MTNLKRLVAAAALLLVLGLTAFADCLPPIPGQVEAPPCAAATQMADDPIAPEIINGAPVSEAPSVELPSLAEIALNVLLLF
ncbi:MAG TPA: hypothetical protein VE863_06690 [Pyrinomonadaceae bacterium]|jgi:hypothetical protein|nr:hypothetical protein [Pyrinomonadaceae bacterium]